MEKFEYKIMSVDSKESDKPDSLLADRLNQYGKDGWELAPVLGALSKALFFITICRLMTIWNCIADIWVQDMKISRKHCHC